MMQTRQEVEDLLDTQIVRLRQDQNYILKDWGEGIGLFRFIQPYAFHNFNFMEYGCPTMIKNGTDDAYESKELTKTIRAMPLPKNSSSIRVHHLPIFKEAQLAAYDYYKRSD